MCDLAREAGVSYKTLSKIECGRVTPRKPDILMKLAKALDVHPNRLLVPAALTPLLASSAGAATPHGGDRRSQVFLITEQEQQELERYLSFLRYLAPLHTFGHKPD